jgi:two-component system copper resistance phosphate regulon response regulator CusR
LLEDDAKVRGFLLESFEREGFTTIPFAAHRDFKEYVMSDEPAADLAVLDRMVGQQDGATLIPLLKQRWPGTKILVLSAISDSEERAKVLDMGADDYQGKPYSLVELLSRVRALLRRAHDGGGGGEKTVLHIGNLEVNLLGHSAKVGATALDLTPKEFRLLSILVREPGKVWSKFKLLDQVWQVNLELESNVVESTVRNIRRKLEQAGCSAAIESKRNLGYWIEA